MRATSTDHFDMQKILRLRPDERSSPAPEPFLDQGSAPPAETILGRLRQAADVSRRNEERAKMQAQELATQLDAAERRIAALEQNLHHAERRANDAEQWLARVLREAREIFSDTGPAEPLARRIR